MSPQKPLSSDKTIQPETSEATQTPGNSLKSFLLGMFLSGLPILIYLSTSVVMTHSTLAEVGTVKLVVSIAIPLICGLLSVVFKQRFTDSLAAIFESIPSVF
ncbi:MAG: hypothetical protein F6K19_05750 [Cyanothece sp. SIO1E1]|nr:hypothetical protein [Cyanothece sp. SIO1E1]